MEVMIDETKVAKGEVSFDEWKADGFSSLAKLPPEERENMQRFLDEWKERARTNPKSDDVKAWRVFHQIEKETSATMKDVTRGGWRPAAYRKPADRS